jgi:hypothetical protein
MIGYEVGARMHRESAGTIPFAGFDAKLAPLQSIFDRGADKNDLMVYRQRGAGTALDDVRRAPLRQGHAGVFDPVSTILAAQTAGSKTAATRGEAASTSRGSQTPQFEFGRHNVLRSDFAKPAETDVGQHETGLRNQGAGRLMMSDFHRFDQIQSDILALSERAARNGYILPRPKNTADVNARFDSIARAIGSADYRRDRNSDGDLRADQFAKFHGSYAKIFGSPGGGITGEGAFSGGVTGRNGPTQLDAAMPRHASMYGQGMIWGVQNDRSGEVSGSGGGAALHDWINNPAGYSYDRALDGNRVTRRDGAGDVGLIDAFQLPSAKDSPDSILAGRRTARASRQRSPDDQKHSDFGMGGHAGLWQMLKNAERILPKPGIGPAEAWRDAAADATEDHALAQLGARKRLQVASMVGSLHDGMSNISGEAIAPDARGNGPSGHRNDPIYTVSMSPAARTLMPLVPTSGTSVRTPPIPGQRNLP